MLIIPIDTFKNRSGIAADPTPKIIMKARGEIRLNTSAVNLLDIKSGLVTYLHFYADDSAYYCKIDNDPKHGLRFLYSKEEGRCSVYFKNTSLFFINKFQPNADSISFELVADDFGKFKMIYIPS